MMCRAGSYTCAITNQDDVVCWGKSPETRLGIDRDDAVGDDPDELADNLRPVYFGKPQPIVRSIACNVDTICAVVNDGDVKCVGKIGHDATDPKIINALGQLGRNVPYVALGTASDGSRLKAKSVSCGTNVCCVLLNDGGSVKCWGSGNALGVSGSRPTAESLTLAVDGVSDPLMGDDMPRVPLGHNATKVRCGDDVCCAILDDGSVKCWGALSSNDILGTGDGRGRGKNNTSTANNTAGDENTTCVHNTTTANNTAGDNNTTTANNTAGDNNTTANNTACDHPSQDVPDPFPSDWLGMGDDLPAVDLGTNRTATEIAFGQSYACAVLDDGSVKCWGEGSGHLFGAGGSGTHISIGGDANYTLSPVLLGTGRRAVDIAAASSAMCVVFEDGDVKCWGLADDGILGAGDTTHRGGSQTDMGDNLPRVDLGRRRRAFRLAKGSGDACGHMCAMLSSEDCPICDDEVTCWGLNDHGQLGVGDAENRGDVRDPFPNTGDTIDFGFDVRVHPKLTDPDSYRDLSVAPPRGHVVSRASGSTCVIVDNGGVKCFGERRQLCIALDDGDEGDEPGELGDALLYAHITTREDVVALAAMHETHCALLDNGDAHCWGRHVDGETGSGDPPDTDGYVNCDARTSRVDFGSDARVESMCGGYNHACALLRDGRVKCWGRNENGKLGIEDPHQSIVGHGDAYMGDDPWAVHLGTTPVTSLACGKEQTCATFRDGSVKCWGKPMDPNATLATYPGSYYYLTGDTLDPISGFGYGAGFPVEEVVMGESHACARSRSGTVKCWGSSASGQLGQGDDLPSYTTPVLVDLDGVVTSIAATKNATCALMSDERVKCWGESLEGALGYNDTAVVGDSDNQMGVHLPPVELGKDAAGNPRRVKALSAGGALVSHMCAVLKAETDCVDCVDEVKCWGANAHGQLGIGNAEFAGSFSNSMGDALPSVNLGAGLGPGEPEAA